MHLKTGHIAKHISTTTRQLNYNTLKPTYNASISNHMNKNRPIVKHSTYSTNDASTAEHVPTEQTVNELSGSAAKVNVPTTRSPSGPQEDDEEVFRIPHEHFRKQKIQDYRRKNTIYGTENDGNISGGLPSI